MRRRAAAALGCTIALLVACGTSEGPSGLNPCTETIPSACGETAHCVLDSNQYLQGVFPGSQTFVVRTMAPEDVTFSFTFTNRLAAGTNLTLTSTEPDCSQPQTYKSTSDIFMLAGASGVLSFPIIMTEAGDHLIQFSSDAYCSFQLGFQEGGGS